MTMLRQVWRIDKAGSLDRLRLQDEALPEPAPGAARVRVETVGLNFADVFACLGLYSATPAGAFIPGLEYAGTIEGFGPGTEARTDLRVGDRVVGLTRFGGYATALNAGVEFLRRSPDGWSAAQAAAWPVQGLTAWYALRPIGAVEAGDVVLVQSAAGGVGLQALDIIDSLGGRAVAVVGHENKRRFLMEHRGLDPARIVLRDPRRFAAQLDAALAAMGADGFDCVLDAVLGETFRPAFDRLRPEGRYALFGAAEFMSPSSRPNYLSLAWRYLRRPRLDPLAMISANRGLLAFNLIWLWERAERLPVAYQELEGLQTRPPHVGEVIPFARAPEAMRCLQSGRTIGKVVLSTE
jgi:NADPH:quinone reductase-like Zn-dependent oxidoreductase